MIVREHIATFYDKEMAVIVAGFLKGISPIVASTDVHCEHYILASIPDETEDLSTSYGMARDVYIAHLRTLAQMCYEAYCEGMKAERLQATRKEE